MTNEVNVPAGKDQEVTDAEQKAHNEKMIRRADGVAEPDQETNQRPENVPEKFWDAETGTVRTEELLKSYTELESNRTTQKPDESTDANEGDGEGAADDKGDDKANRSDEANAADKELAAKGLSLDEFNDEFKQNGVLSEESFAKLEAGGFARDVVESFIEGQKARSTIYDGKVTEALGGEEAKNTMFEWAKHNLTKEEVTHINAAFASMDLVKAQSAVNDLKSRYVEANGSDGVRLEGGNSSSGSGSYESWEQVKKDMRKPEYKKDPAFQAKVQAKLGRSQL